MTQALNDAIVRALPTPETGEKTYRFAGARLGGVEAPRGFGIKVHASGTRAWILDYRFERRERQYTIGRHPDWSPLLAVREARELRLRIDRGEDPTAKRHEADHMLTVGQLVDGWASTHLAKRSPGYRQEAVYVIERAFKPYWPRPTSALTRRDIMVILDRIVAAGHPTMATRTMQYARACWTWAHKREKVSDNPFLNLPFEAHNVVRDRVLAAEETAAIWRAAGTLDYPWGPFYRFALLTLVRRSEAAGARWDEIDLDKRIWSIPASRMKIPRPHVVHLAAPAIALLSEIPRARNWDYVFSDRGRKPITGFSSAKRKLDRALAAAGTPLAPWTVHDFRRCVTPLNAPPFRFNEYVLETLLAHETRRGSARNYNLYNYWEERVQVLDAWAAHLSGGLGGNVIPLMRVS